MIYSIICSFYEYYVTLIKVDLKTIKFELKKIDKN